MDARYLRVKNWGEFQHYRDKEPGWIKLYARSLRDDLFRELDEVGQWQLVRLWLVASQSSRFTLDDEGRKVPALVDDEQSLRRSIATIKKIPLAKLIRDGWLIPVAVDELVDEHPEDAVSVENRPVETSPGLDARLDAGLDSRLDQLSSPPSSPPSSPGLGSSRAPARGGAQTRGNRDLEVLKRSSSKAVTVLRPDAPADPDERPTDITHIRQQITASLATLTERAS